MAKTASDGTGENHPGRLDTWKSMLSDDAGPNPPEVVGTEESKKWDFYRPPF